MDNNLPQNTGKKYINWLWPEVNTIEDSKNTARYGVIAAGIVSGTTAIFAILSLFGFVIIGPLNIWALLDASLFALIAFGIHKMSRTASLLGLLFYLLEQINVIYTAGGTNWFVLIVLATLFIHGVRGTFAYNKLGKAFGF